MYKDDGDTRKQKTSCNITLCATKPAYKSFICYLYAMFYIGKPVLYYATA